MELEEKEELGGERLSDLQCGRAYQIFFAALLQVGFQEEFLIAA